MGRMLIKILRVVFKFFSITYIVIGLTSKRTTEMSKVDEFYPIYNLQESPLIELSLMLKLKRDLEMAKKGNKLSESKLCNRIGSLRRSADFRDLNPDLQNLLRESVDWLRSVGRKVNLGCDDPRQWISTRDGRPRW